MPPVRDPAVETAISTDTKVKKHPLDPAKNNITLKDEQIWLDKATVACTQILECVKNGLSEEDGCILAGISYTEYEEIRRRAPQIVRMIEKEKVVYKLELMKPITEAIKKGDTSKAMWIAERKYPSEFGSSTKRVITPPADNTDPLSDIIKRIQDGEGPGAQMNQKINNIQHEQRTDSKS